MARPCFSLLIPAALLSLVLGFSSFVPAARAQAYSCGSAGDDFDRPNSGDMGPNWAVQSGTWAISGNAARQSAEQPGVMVFTGASSPNAEVCVDVLKQNNNSYRVAGIVLGNGGLGLTNRILVDNESGPAFNRMRILGVDGDLISASSSITPFLTARLHARQVGSVITLDIDPNNDGIADQTFSADLGSNAATGPGAGVVSNVDAIVDSFRWAPYSPPAAPIGGGMGGGGPAADVLKPVLGGLSLSRSSFAAATSGAAFSAKRKRRGAPVGTKLSFNLSEPSSVSFRVQRKTSGRRVSGRCKARTRANRTRRRCTLWKRVKGSFTFPGKARRNRLTFRGRVGGRKLKVGSYRLNATATDPAKNTSVPKNKAFRIVR